MILVINLNASVDKRYTLPELTKGKVMRAASVDNTPGGKGLHVANVATILGADCLATGMLGGKSGEFIAEKLEDYGIRQDFVHIAGETRSCLAIITDDGVQTEILEPGPQVTAPELDLFWQKYNALLESADIIVASGSVPRGVPVDFYARLIREAGAVKKPFLLDTSGELLRAGIAAQPFFIKPNGDEIAALTGRSVTTEAEILAEVRHFMEQGIRLAVVSLGAAGSVAGYEGQLYRVTVPKIEALNPVGSGDSYVAGIAVGLSRRLAIEDTLKLAAACGTANALEPESGFVKKTVVEELIARIQVERL